ncbi:hypothetical protein L6E12_03045 [Actinokineospora sp. PR83]|uniref:hypothetical protein n=1 Tax=Actinokineospora sp. PR83 TaxID=2884908 RepID=UPI001F16C09F|nr:hypothetical protein [Actinokineospora sp. PR83]MCG8914772.1 hypothetical protein [Actinokineospora sp. PR83]
MAAVEGNVRNGVAGSTFAIICGALGVLFSVVLTFSYPLIAPVVALAAVGALAFFGALVIDLGLLSTGNTVTTTEGPISTNR